MLSKFLQPGYRQGTAVLLSIRLPQRIKSRKILGLIPPSQYDVPIPKKLQFPHVIKEYWETIPLFFVTFFSFGLMTASIIWACKKKVDVVFTTHNRSNISRTMDLRNPSVNKIVIINQRYLPWPEMQDALDKMAAAEKRALVRLQSCNHP